MEDEGQGEEEEGEEAESQEEEDEGEIQVNARFQACDTRARAVSTLRPMVVQKFWFSGKMYANS